MKLGTHTHLFLSNSRLSSRVTRSGQTFFYAYDALGRVTHVNAPSATADTSYSYDNFSNLVSVSSAGRTITNGYDARSRLQAGFCPRPAPTAR